MERSGSTCYDTHDTSAIQYAMLSNRSGNAGSESEPLYSIKATLGRCTQQRLVHWMQIGAMLGKRPRRWLNNETTLGTLTAARDHNTHDTSNQCWIKVLCQHHCTGPHKMLWAINPHGTRVLQGSNFESCVWRQGISVTSFISPSLGCFPGPV